MANLLATRAVHNYSRNMGPKDNSSKAKRTPRQIFWERFLASTVLLYTVVATFVVWRTLAKYGVNVFIFFVIDGITSWTYGISTARLIVGVIKRDWKSTRMWAVAAAASFVAPQIYILVSARHAPRDVYLIVIIVITLLILLALLTLLLQIKKSRNANPGREK